MVAVRDLTFAFPDGSTGLQNINLDLPAGSRTLLIGGKSRLLQCSDVTFIYSLLLPLRFSLQSTFLVALLFAHRPEHMHNISQRMAQAKPLSSAS